MRLGASGRRSYSTERDLTSVVGMRRVDWVRLTVGDGPTVAEAVGVVHRRPSVRPLPLPLAARLTADGVPFVVRHQNESSRGTAFPDGDTNGTA